MTPSNSEAERFANGARFVRAALQVNPFAYLGKNAKETGGLDEAEYNQSIVDACLASEIEIIAVTDHYAIADSESLIRLAEEHGICAFPGFEASTSEGVHFLCIFDRGTPSRTVQNCIGNCGVVTDADQAGIGDITSKDLMKKAPEWGALVIAAHVTDPSGLLSKLSGLSRVECWTSDDLTCAAIARPRSEIGTSYDGMLSGSAKDYARTHNLAVIYAADVIAAEDFASKPSWTYLKVSELTLDGLRHSFLDPDSRVRLPEELSSSQVRHLAKISWTGGFVDGVSLPLNQSLNVLIGPRGAGKSTVLESIRYVLDLDPIGSEAKIAHDGFVKNVLGSGTKVVVEVEDPESSSTWTIERAVPGETVVTKDGTPTNVSPASLVGTVEFFGQHEVAELAKMPEARANLLERFVRSSPDPKRSSDQISGDLATNRKAILDEIAKIDRLSGRQDRLPVVEEQLEKYDKAGARGRLKSEAAFEKEEPAFTDTEALLDDIEIRIAELQEVEFVFLADEILVEAPSAEGLKKIRTALTELNAEFSSARTQLETKLAAIIAIFDEVKGSRTATRSAQNEAFLQQLRELKADSVDGERILDLEKEKAELESEAAKIKQAEEERSKLRTNRKLLLKEWDDFRRREFEKLKIAAQEVSAKLTQAVRVTCDYEGDRSQLKEFLDSRISGQRDNVMKAIDAADVDFGPGLLAEACRKGASKVSELLGIEGKQVDKVAELSEEALLMMEELGLGATTSIDLRVGQDEKGRPAWRGLENLSTGEKATAILLILLLGSDDNSPLVIDQAEDDLDNAFIADDIVPKLRAEKLGRQFVLSTHNPNIPVLGDAEQVIRLTAEGEALTGGKALVRTEHVGSLDKQSVRSAVEALEGGREAFERRRRRYGY